MNDLRDSFENVADWCEKHLEDRVGREIGMLLGAASHTYGRLATLPSRVSGEERASAVRSMDAEVEGFLYEFSTRFLLVSSRANHKPKLMEPAIGLANMTYDPGRPMYTKILEPAICRVNMTYDPGRRPTG